MDIKDLDVVKIKDGRVGTVLEHKNNFFLLEIGWDTGEIITVDINDIIDVIKGEV